jgi:hypothetical protein
VVDAAKTLFPIAVCPVPEVAAVSVFCPTDTHCDDAAIFACEFAPIATDPLFELDKFRALMPIAILLLRAVADAKAFEPMAMLLLPVSIAAKAFTPTAVLFAPLVLAAKALTPTTVFVATALPPLPTVSP